MRPILATAIVLLGLNSAAPEAKLQDSLLADVGSVGSWRQFAPSINKADRGNVLVEEESPAQPPEEAEDEDDIHSPTSPAPAFAGALSDQEPADTLDDLCAALLTSAEENGLPVPFFANLIWQESRLRDDAVSRVGALGIAQFMPQVAAEAGVGDPFDPRQAIPASARFLHVLRERFGNLGFVAAAYNAGARRVTEWLIHRRKLPRETRTYVERVTGRSVEQWRKRPPRDLALTFARPLPCRDLPAFADLEQARLRLRQEQEQRRHAEQAARHAAQRRLSHSHRGRVVARKAPRGGSAAHRALARRARAHAVKPGGSKPARKLARRIRRGRHDLGAATAHHARQAQAVTAGIGRRSKRGLTRRFPAGQTASFDRSAGRRAPAPRARSCEPCRSARRTPPVIRVNSEISIDEREITETFVRASGPGGQNVNKLASAVQLRFDVRSSPSLPHGVRARLERLAGARLTREGVLVITAQRHRTQARNREDALDRLIGLIGRAAVAPRPRRPTRPTAASRERRVEAKKRRSRIKGLRGAKPALD